MRQKYQMLSTAVSKLCSFFNPTAKLSLNKRSNVSTNITNRYVKATDLLSTQQKKALEEHGEVIEKGFDKFSAY